jgi:hypothetical protein
LPFGKGCRAALHLAGMGNGMPVENSTRKCAALWALLRARTAFPTSPTSYNSATWRSENRLVSRSKMSQRLRNADLEELLIHFELNDNPLGTNN